MKFQICSSVFSESLLEQVGLPELAVVLRPPMTSKRKLVVIQFEALSRPALECETQSRLPIGDPEARNILRRLIGPEQVVVSHIRFHAEPSSNALATQTSKPPGNELPRILQDRGEQSYRAGESIFPVLDGLAPISLAQHLEHRADLHQRKTAGTYARLLFFHPGVVRAGQPG